MSDEPAVWIGCLGCYNAGTLTGEWFRALDCPTEMDEFDKAIGFDDAFKVKHLAGGDADGESTTAKGVSVSKDHGHPVYGPHDELWVMDFENFKGLLTSECSPSTAQEIAQWIEDHGEIDWGAFAAFAANQGEKPSTADERDELAERFGEQYRGKWDSLKEWAWDFLEDTAFFEGLPDHLEAHKGAIVEDWLSDAEAGGSLTYINGYVFFQ